MSLPHPAKLALALSGGGFRATLFHLGVIRFLYDIRRLHEVTHICSVSGGSVMAAHLVLNWECYTDYSEAGKTRFEKAAQKIVEFVQSDVRGDIVRRWFMLRISLALFWVVFGFTLFSGLSQSAEDVVSWIGLAFCVSGLTVVTAKWFELRGAYRPPMRVGRRQILFRITLLAMWIAFGACLFGGLHFLAYSTWSWFSLALFGGVALALVWRWIGVGRNSPTPEGSASRRFLIPSLLWLACGAYSAAPLLCLNQGIKPAWPWLGLVFWGAVAAGVAWRWLRYGRTQMLQEHYDRLFRKEETPTKAWTFRRLGEQREGKTPPELFLLATSLTGNEAFAFDKEGAVWFYKDVQTEERTRLVREDLRVSLAVAASSAFPPLFPPLFLDANRLSCRRDYFPIPLRLTDGGVFDNLGLRRIDDLRAAGVHFDAVVASNAQSGLDRDDSSFNLLLSRTIRVNDVMMIRVGDLESEKAKSRDPESRKTKSRGPESRTPEPKGPPFVDCSLRGEELRRTAAADGPPGCYSTPQGVQSDIVCIRTDLDRFSDVEIHLLVSHGYAVARRDWEHRWRQERETRNNAIRTRNADRKARNEEGQDEPEEKSEVTDWDEPWSPIPLDRGLEVVKANGFPVSDEERKKWRWVLRRPRLWKTREWTTWIYLLLFILSAAGVFRFGWMWWFPSPETTVCPVVVVNRPWEDSVLKSNARLTEETASSLVAESTEGKRNGAVADFRLVKITLAIPASSGLFQTGRLTCKLKFAQEDHAFKGYVCYIRPKTGEARFQFPPIDGPDVVNGFSVPPPAPGETVELIGVWSLKTAAARIPDTIPVEFTPER